MAPAPARSGSIDGTGRLSRVRLKDLALLGRFRVSLMVAAATLFGAVLAVPRPTEAHWLVTFGTFMLAAGCSAANQAQEAELDALIPRTSGRPVPQGRVGRHVALSLGLALALLGCGLLYAAGGLPVALTGVGILIVYNGIYTPLKRHTSFALLVGAIVGALPPVVGWMAVGGLARSALLMVVYTVYLLWQIPHFWLHAARDRDAYRAAGVPLPMLSVPSARYGRLLRVWFHAYAVAVLMLPVFPFVEGLGARVAVTACGVTLLLAAALAPGRGKLALRLADATLCGIMLILLVDRYAHLSFSL